MVDMGKVEIDYFAFLGREELYRESAGMVTPNTEYYPPHGRSGSVKMGFRPNERFSVEQSVWNPNITGYYWRALSIWLGYPSLVQGFVHSAF